MDINNELVRANLTQTLKQLQTHNDIALRGLRDLGILPKVSELLTQIERSFYQAKYRKCIELCEEVLATEKDHFLSIVYRALSREYLQEYKSALSDFEYLTNREKNIAEFQAHKGICLLMLGKERESITAFNTALDIDPQNITSMLYLGSTTLDSDEALYWWNKILHLEPYNHGVLMEKGDILKDTGNLEEAVQIYRHALSLVNSKKSNKELYKFQRQLILHNLGQCLYQLGLYNEAAHYFHQLLDIDPHDAIAKMGLKKINQK